MKDNASACYEDVWLTFGKLGTMEN